MIFSKESETVLVFFTIFWKSNGFPHPSHCGLRKMAHIPEYKGYLLLEENRNIMFNISDAKVCERGREEERGKEGQGSREES